MLKLLQDFSSGMWKAALRLLSAEGGVCVDVDVSMEAVQDQPAHAGASIGMTADPAVA